MGRRTKTEFPGATKTVDKYGTIRWRYRKKGFTAQIQGAYGSDEFRTSYEQAVAGSKTPIGKERQIPFSLGALIASYYATAAFQKLAPSTKRAYRDCLEPLRDAYGHRRVTVGHFEANRAQKLLDAYAAIPGKGNNVRKRLMAIFRHAILLGWRKDNPIEATHSFGITGDGHHSWSDQEISDYLDFWPVGTVQHLAVRLMLAVAAARADAVALGWGNVANGRLSYRRQKTKNSGGILIDIPLPADLAAILPRDAKTFLQTQAGKQRSAEGLGNLIKAAATDAGMPHLSSHGLRKACARRLAEAGATAQEIGAVTGHKGLAEISHYTQARDRARLADQAALKLTKVQDSFVKTPSQPSDNTGEK